MIKYNWLESKQRFQCEFSSPDKCVWGNCSKQTSTCLGYSCIIDNEELISKLKTNNTKWASMNLQNHNNNVCAIAKYIIENCK